jgi:uncharacterized LabA/DUF88 family protein
VIGGQNSILFEMPEKVVILLDGGFVKKKLQQRSGHFPTKPDVVAVCTAIMQDPLLSAKELFRVYYYDAPPFEGTSTNPIDKSKINFSTTVQAGQNRSLIDGLELEPDFAVRRGALVQSGWKLGRSALRRLSTSSTKSITAKDIVPDMAQKGVDIRIGLDMAWIALKHIADVLVLVTGDSDFVPVMKFARREGLKVYLQALGHGVRRELKAHADRVL